MLAALIQNSANRFSTPISSPLGTGVPRIVGCDGSIRRSVLTFVNALTIACKTHHSSRLDRPPIHSARPRCEDRMDNMCLPGERAGEVGKDLRVRIKGKLVEHESRDSGDRETERVVGKLQRTLVVPRPG